MKKRIIPSLLLRGGSTNVCLSQAFQPWRTVGTLAQQLKLHISRQCDELLIINLNPLDDSNSFRISSRISNLIVSNVDVPISFAGGVSDEIIASYSINTCFDKVYVTSSFLFSPQCVKRIASVVGEQSVGVCLPYKIDPYNQIRYVWNYQTSSLITNHPLSYYIDLACSMGAGELFLYSVDRDGSLLGLDEDIILDIKNLSLSCPVIIGGGAGTASHFSAVLSSDLIQGVVAGSIFSLTEETPATIRSHCIECGIPMRRV